MLQNLLHNDGFATPPNLCTGWQKLLEQQASCEYFKQLQQQVSAARQAGEVIYPPAPDVFNALALTPYSDVKVVVLGQDPYHQPGQAQGLAFSVPPGVKLPPSLRNVYKALANDDAEFAQRYGQVTSLEGDLQSWAKQGVLLLNTVLTVPQGNAHGHAKWGWEIFTQALLRYLNSHPQPLVLLLWGKHAQQAATVIDDPRHLKLNSVHPSPLSAHRGFFDCKHFSRANAFLKQHKRSPVDWSSVLINRAPEQKQTRQHKLAW